MTVWAATASTSSAQDTYWTNPTLGNWFSDVNWSNGVPAEFIIFQDAYINNGGTAFITSPGANANKLHVGNAFGGGSLIISNGGTLRQGLSAPVGATANFTASVTVNGSGSAWDVSDALLVGINGTMRVENGGDVHSDSGRIDGSSGTSGSVTVTGAGSTWTMLSGPLNSFAVGESGSASLTISNGGTVSNYSAYIGYSSGSSGTATITGTGSFWNNGGNVYVGDDVNGGAGALRISDRGLVQAASLRVSNSGSVEVNNGQSTFAGLNVTGGATPPDAGGALGSLIVANTSSGRMVVQSGGTVSNSLGTIAASSGTVGSVLVQGPNSTWTNTDQLSVGHNGTGTLEVRSGGTLTSVRGFAGAGAFSTGSIAVSDPGSTWTASGSFFIGNLGSGLLEVLNGGVASTAGNSHLGITAGATGDVNVSGAGSTLNVAVLLNIGGDSAVARGTGSVRIADGGTVNVGSATNLYSTGRLELVDATTFTGDLNSFGGLIRTNGATTLANPIHLNAGGVFVDNVTPGSNSTFNGNIDGPGGLTKSGISGFTGHGTLTLTGANTYLGPTTVNAGTLLVDGSITSATTVNSGATLGGSGTIAGNVTNNGNVAPGNSPGTLHITGNYTQNAAGTLKIQLESPSSFDTLAVTGNMALGGTLEISLINGFMPSVDQAFNILSWGSLAGAFSSVIVPSVDGLEWDTSQLSMGVLSVEVTGLPGDYNQNGVVDAADYTVWRDSLDQTGTGLAADGDLSGAIGEGDLTVWQVNFGRALGSGANTEAAVPEPAPLVLLALGLSFLFSAPLSSRVVRWTPS